MPDSEGRCCQDACPEPGCWGVGARAFTNAGRHIPGEVVFVGLLVCDHHRDSLKPSDVITDDNWPNVAGSFNMIGLRADREKMQLFFESVPVPVGVCAA